MLLCFVSFSLKVRIAVSLADTEMHLPVNSIVFFFLLSPPPPTVRAEFFQLLDNKIFHMYFEI